ncbi:MAG: T9SS type A sorting domain-containing protein, partial [Candidatus Cloacimonadaceae bacterium]|nr:T9SS type A sorting domain-containing protein [Candidatus Cloacimonadaceae bacterium]
NNGNGFPTSSGLTYFSYMAIMVNPDADPESNPPVFGLMYTVNLSGVISPALYKITGTGFGGLQNIGTIQTHIDTPSNTLFLSCAVADLMADPDFTSWFDPAYPLLGTMAITSRITLISGIQEADRSNAANILILPRLINTQNLHQPSLSDLSYQYTNPENSAMEIEISYSDMDHNFPIYHQVYIDGSFLGDLYPVGSIDFTGLQRYHTGEISLPAGWNTIELRFSDNGTDYATQTIINTSSASDLVSSPAAFAVYPNPATNLLNIKLSSSLKQDGYINIYNLRGQIIKAIPINTYKEDSIAVDISMLPPGLYFVNHGSTFKKIIKAARE